MSDPSITRRNVIEVVEADLTWTGEAFDPGIRVAIDDAGIIVEASRSQRPVTRRLNGAALLPGFVNAHSHAFQRGLRGHGEVFPAASGSFWSWREAMYSLVERLDEAEVHRLSLQAFREMKSAGMTSVGEFHYVHHGGDMTPDPARRWAFDDAVISAARDARIRLCLLQTCYLTGGIDDSGPSACYTDAAGGQRRFDGGTVDAYLESVDRLRAAAASDPFFSVGIVAHSIRAVPIESIARLDAYAREHALPMHLHLEEQRQEVSQVKAMSGVTPMRLLLDHEIVGPHLTSVHCTHSTREDLADYGAAGGQVCLCPLTEANLGDGIADLPAMRAADISISLGSDSNARISMLEEMRWMEYGQRLHSERRGVDRDGAGRVARRLVHAGTEAGAQALGFASGSIATGTNADFTVIDLTHPQLADASSENLAEVIVFGAGDGVIQQTSTGGHWESASRAAPTLRA